MARAAPVGFALALVLGSCFEGQALWGERCEADADCGPGLPCQDDGVCARERRCSGMTIDLADLRPQVAWLLDHSKSMRRCLDDPEERERCAQADDPPGPSRWDGVHQLVHAVVPEFADRVDFGAVVFPTPTLISEQGICNLNDNSRVPFDAEDAAAAILAAVPEDTSSPPIGENPLREAWSNLFEPSEGGPVRARAIVLVSDNPPNCTATPQISSDFAEKLDVEVYPLVEQSFAGGIPTIVVGISVMDVMAPPAAGDSMIDDVNPHEYFNQLALAGGAAQAGPEHYLHLRDSAALPQVIAGLRERLAPLADEVDACRIRIDAAPDYPDLVALDVDGRMHRADPDCTDEQAWRWRDDDHLALELCPDACARLHAGAIARLRFGCP
ncbi:hypothetical protein SAMN02745121_03655 [Nannocystis exedens]|uniref:VWFA domain-containing protein n=1 Tax=Nannocystis exedens TaxID=54 RepID=A0A1I1ZAC2_9BACT|nr:hypothetical protein [Nannocystis exedens]PCC75137.1 hypothetical protein NAEX_08243 [Nannocystis exedens]SFE27280.1 hypothetical protein SAMN02745121_03655 [Nannocystis exedens]